jgi:hypothetical protein
MTKRATGKPFDSKTGRAASLKSPWRRQQFCGTQRAKTFRDRFDREDEPREDPHDD